MDWLRCVEGLEGYVGFWYSGSDSPWTFSGLGLPRALPKRVVSSLPIDAVDEK